MLAPTKSTTQRFLTKSGLESPLFSLAKYSNKIPRKCAVALFVILRLAEESLKNTHPINLFVSNQDPSLRSG